MIQQTIHRLTDWVPSDRHWIVTGKSLKGSTAKQLPDIPKSNLLIEPVGRNTAPAIALAAMHLVKKDPDATMLVMPADHVLGPAEAFRSAVETGEALLESDPERLLLFGVPPTFPAVGYGYIERGEELSKTDGDGPPIYAVERFREKPDHDTAASYLDSGNFYWNCGIFLWRADTFLKALETHQPEMHRRIVTIGDAIEYDRIQMVLKEEFPRMPSVSVDYGILEQAERIGVIEAPFEWDDLGSWSSLERQLPQDEHGNTIDGKFVGLNTSGCIIRTTSDHLIATIGLKDCVIVQTPDATLIAQGTDENAVRELVDKLREEGHEDLL